jgi:ABC-2 type transport system permease protein
MSIFIFALKENLRHRISLLMILVFPLVLLFIPSMDGMLPMGFGLFGLLNFYSAFLMSRPIAEDRMNKVMVRIAASPVSHFYYLVSHLAAAALLLSIQCLVFVIASAIFFGFSMVNYFVLFLLYCSYSVMGISFALAWNMMFLSYTTSFALFSGVGSIMCLISGLSFPLRLLPIAMQRTVRVLPTYWLAHGLGALGDSSPSGLLLSVVILWTFTGIFLLVGSKRRL